MMKRRMGPPRYRDMRSGLEEKVAAYLKSKNVPFEYETLKIPFIVPAKKRTYNPDFMLPNGIIIEAKGKLDRDVREKMALVIEQNPHLDIRFLFMRDNKIAKNSKTRYSTWCDKRGIKYAVSEQGIIPAEWIEEALAPPRLDGTTGVSAGPAAAVRTVGKRRGRKQLESDMLHPLDGELDTD